MKNHTQSHLSKSVKQFPSAPGVYLMKDEKRAVIYVGMAGSLKKRVGSYFTKAHDTKTESLVAHIASIDYIKAGSVLEAIFKEAELIKEYQPKYNIDQKDDKSFIYVVITKEEYPRVLMARERELKRLDSRFRGNGKMTHQAIFGPFTSTELAQSLLKHVRRMIPFSACKPPRSQKKQKPCFYYHLGLCPGVCIGAITPREYRKIIRNIILFFQGKRKRVMANLVREMERLSKRECFEEAARVRNQLRNLKHIHDVALIKNAPLRRIKELNTSFHRIEGYDISNIGGSYSVGSMVVFTDCEPDKGEYRKFKIKTVHGINDTAMIQEVMRRRFAHSEWEKPDIVLIDGGKAQVNTGAEVLVESDLGIPVVGIAKGPTRKKVELVFSAEAMPFKDKIAAEKNTLVRVRDEAHRFAVSYHRKTREHSLIKN